MQDCFIISRNRLNKKQESDMESQCKFIVSLKFLFIIEGLGLFIRLFALNLRAEATFEA